MYFLPSVAVFRFVSPADSHVWQNKTPLLLCVINADEIIFNPALLTQGQQGGYAAAQQLTQRIAEQMVGEDIESVGRLSFWVTLFFNRVQLMDALTGNNICTQEQFEAFLAVSCCVIPAFSNIDTREGIHSGISQVLDG